MNVRALHDWNLSPAEALRLQERLARQVRTRGAVRSPRIIAGADISMERHSSAAWAGVVLLEFPSLAIIDRFSLTGVIDFPYIPGLLSFREGPLLLRLFEQIAPAPDVVFFDGQGIAHPRRLGLASHLGLFLDCPTIGCAKSRLVGRHEPTRPEKGSLAPLLDEEGGVLGMAVRTRANTKPVYISVGHRIDLDQAVCLTLACAPRYRIPEPTRQAHHLVNESRLADQNK
ncbi:MAG: deoxyribonuclease V [Nitrospinaceae bacterium]|nr:MAG: deoxyribonuclease V [Nitrospinaceae bacterium]